VRGFFFSTTTAHAGTTKGNTMKKTLLALMACLLIPLTLFAGGAQAAEDCYSSGTRVGTVQKLAVKGYVNKSYEGELVQAGIKTKADAGISNVWHFSITDPKVAATVDQAATAGQPIALRYCQRAFRNPAKTDTSYIVTSATTSTAPPGAPAT
jgi:hypothetical protein